MDRALPTMRDVGDRIGLLNNYFSRTPAFTLDLKKSCIEAGMVVLQLFSFLVRFIRNDMPVQAAQSSGKWRSCLAYAETSRSTYYVLGYSQENGWQPLRDQCVQAVSKMDAVLSQAEQYSKTTKAPPLNRVNDGANSRPDLPDSPSSLASHLMQVSLAKDPAKLPCVVLPNIRTPRFFDRVEPIQRIEEHFHTSSTGADEHPFRSLALHGLGGVGKTTIALKYAENKLHRCSVLGLQ